jgi:hypothetical protein
MKITATIAILISICFLAGCSMSILPDGTKTFALNAEDAARAITIHSSK